MKDLVILILAGATLVLSLIFQPWCELGFGLDKNEITTRSMLEGPLNGLAEMTKPLTGVAESIKNQVQTKLAEQAKANGVTTPNPNWNKDVLAGNYAYVAVMALALVAAATAIILVGREEAEEKLVLPVKK